MLVYVWTFDNSAWNSASDAVLRNPRIVLERVGGREGGSDTYCNILFMYMYSIRYNAFYTQTRMYKHRGRSANAFAQRTKTR